MTNNNIQEQQQLCIAIIGGGPGGLTLARILQQHGIKADVYEREASASSRKQGGSLDIHHDSGQWALDKAGLLEQFRDIARYEGEDFRLLDNSGKVYMDEIADPQGGGRPEIDRGDLRELLLNSLDPDIIRWGHELEQAVTLEDGRHELQFENGHKAVYDLVVGADGAFSRIRPLVTDAVPAYSGISMIELYLDAVADKHPEIAAFNRRGKLFALADHKGILGQLNGDGRLCVYAAFRVDQDWLDTCGIPFNQPEQAKLQLLQQFEDWDETLKKYIEFASAPILPRRIYMLPTGLKWAHKPGITLIGDAAHLMSPFAGEGVNMAMQDAAVLAMSIVQHSDINQAIEAYEVQMFEYSSKSAKESFKNLDLIFSEDAAAKLTDLMNQYHEQL